MEEEAPKTEAPSSGGGKNIGMAVLAYFGILVLIPLLTAAKTDSFVKFHTQQGLALLIFGVILGAVSAIPFLGWVVGGLGSLLSIVLFIMGIINASGGKEVELPVIGKYGSKFNI